MSYSKLEVRYIGDGINSAQHHDCRGGEKKKTIILSKKVQEYGDRYGYGSLTVTYSSDHIIIKHGYETLFDQDINGASNEYITRITGYDWLY